MPFVFVMAKSVCCVAKVAARISRGGKKEAPFGFQIPSREMTLMDKKAGEEGRTRGGMKYTQKLGGRGSNVLGIPTPSLSIHKT